MSAGLGVLIADGIIKAILLGIEANKIRDTVRPLAPEAIPAALEALCLEFQTKAHAAVNRMP